MIRILAIVALALALSACASDKNFLKHSTAFMLDHKNIGATITPTSPTSGIVLELGYTTGTVFVMPMTTAPNADGTAGGEKPIKATKGEDEDIRCMIAWGSASADGGTSSGAWFGEGKATGFGCRIIAARLGRATN